MIAGKSPDKSEKRISNMSEEMAKALLVKMEILEGEERGR